MLFAQDFVYFFSALKDALLTLAEVLSGPCLWKRLQNVNCLYSLT